MDVIERAATSARHGKGEWDVVSIIADVRHDCKDGKSGVCPAQGNTSGFHFLFLFECQISRGECALTLELSCPLLLKGRNIQSSRRTSGQRYVMKIMIQ